MITLSGLCQTWSETPKTGFVVTRLIYQGHLFLAAVLFFSENGIVFLFMHIFSSPEPKAHGELIGYPWSGVRRPSVCPSFTISNIFFSKTAWPMKAKFYVEPPLIRGTKVCSRHLSHMTKMAATPIYGKNPSKIFFSRTGGSIFTKLGM